MIKQTAGDWQSGTPPTCPKCHSSDKVAGIINTEKKNDRPAQTESHSWKCTACSHEWSRTNIPPSDTP